jgi:parallel beta-helix repeat protein
MPKAETCLRMNRLKGILTASMVALLVCSLFFVCSSVRGSTDVGGIISQNTVWNIAGSPYQVTKKTLVDTGVILTIEPGVIVNINNDVYLQVNGTIIAKGTSSSKIHFYGGQVRLTAGTTSYNEQTGVGSIMENVVFESGIDKRVTITDCSPKIINCEFYGQLYLTQSSSVVSNSYFNKNIHIIGGSCAITKNTIKGASLYIDPVQGTNSLNVVVSENTITDFSSGSGIYVSANAIGSILNLRIEKNLIANNQVGIFVVSMMSPNIQSNTIVNNEVGIKLLDYQGQTYVLQYNNLVNKKNLFLNQWVGCPNIDAPNNWWGTTDKQAISDSIYDYNSDFNLGKVNFTPFLTEPNPNAPDASSIPTLTPEVSPVPEPSATPTPTSDQPDQMQQAAKQGLFIESNSTVSAFSFNSSTPEISFTVYGPNGTEGYVKATISKSFMPNAFTIKVFLDGNQVDYQLASDENSWIITFNYQHSTHRVTINSALQVAGNLFGVEYWIWAAAIVVIALTVAAMVLVKVAKAKND